MTARKLFYNGKIFTSVRDQGLHEAMLIADGRVVRVAKEAELRREMEEVRLARACPRNAL